jgi:SPP1 family predicted phage head-tail adaptor
MSINAGKLRHRIAIEQPIRTQDPETGEVLIEWDVLHASVAAAIEPLSAREFIASRSMQSQITARITIRYRAGLTADMRIIHKGKIYNPEGWLPDLNSGLEYLTAPVSEGVNEG